MIPSENPDGTPDGDPNNTDTTESKSTPVAAIAGGVVGGVVALALIGILIWFLMRRKKQAQNIGAPSTHPTGPNELPSDRRNELSSETKYTPAPPYYYEVGNNNHHELYGQGTVSPLSSKTQPTPQTAYSELYAPPLPQTHHAVELDASVVPNRT